MADPKITKKRGRPAGSEAPSHIEDERSYRRRAETAELILTEHPARTTIKEAVYWPHEGSYGSADMCSNLEDAKQRARRTLTMGYGRDSKSVVHIIETTTRIIEVSIIGSAESVEA